MAILKVSRGWRWPVGRDPNRTSGWPSNGDQEVASELSDSWAQRNSCASGTYPRPMAQPRSGSRQRAKLAARLSRCLLGSDVSTAQSASAFRFRLRQHPIGTRKTELPFPIGLIARFLRALLASYSARPILINLGCHRFCPLRMSIPIRAIKTDACGRRYISKGVFFGETI
jgi:hypothetical protein